MKNNFQICGDTTKIYLNSEKHGEIITLIDTDDLPKAHEFRNTWCATWNKRSKTFNVRGSLYENGKQITVSMPRWLTDAPEHLVVDHQNHDTLDNRRTKNLRLCTNAENQRNKRKRTGTSSKYIGVHFDKGTNKYKAAIKAKGKTLPLGYYGKEEDAAEAYNRAAVIHHGEFANLNKIEVSE